MSDSDPAFAYLSLGKLKFVEAGGKMRQIESHFGSEIRERMLRLQQKHNWKQGKEGVFSSQMLWGIDPVSADDRMSIRLTSLTSLGPGKIGYILETDSIGGFLAYEMAEDHERRLFHKENFSARDLSAHPDGEKIAVATNYGSSLNIAVMDGDGRDLEEVTEGDSIDCAPSWVPGTNNRLIYQSAGVARNRDGLQVGTGPFSVESLDFDRKEVETLCEDNGFDFLEPKMDADGTLYFIRRPYEYLGRPPTSFMTVVKDFFLFPIRLVRAIYEFLNVFSMMFAKKPLRNAGGPKNDEDINKIVLQGKLIEVDRALAKAGKEGGGLVPRNWELIRRSEDGGEERLAQGVCDFELLPDGGVLYSTGNAIYRLPRDGKRKKIHSDRVIEEIAVIHGD